MQIPIFAAFIFAAVTLGVSYPLKACNSSSNSSKTDSSSQNKSSKSESSYQERISGLDAYIKKLLAKQEALNAVGKKDIANAAGKLAASLIELKTAMAFKNKNAIKTAKAEVATASNALKTLEESKNKSKKSKTESDV